MAEHPYTPIDIDADHFKRLERYIVVLYDKTSQLESINEKARSCSAGEASQWMAFHQGKMPYCSIQSVQPIKQVSGPPVISHSKQHLLQKTGAGQRMKPPDPGLPCEQPFQQPLQLAVNW